MPQIAQLPCSACCFRRQLSEMTLERVRRIEIALEAHETPVHPDDEG